MPYLERFLTPKEVNTGRRNARVDVSKANVHDEVGYRVSWDTSEGYQEDVV